MGLLERLLLVASILVMGGLMMLSYNSEKGIRDWMLLDRELKQIRRDIAIIGEESTEIVRRINRLKQDPVYIEHLARHELEMTAQNELVFRIRETPRGKN
jgi:cell division protein FtsB